MPYTDWFLNPCNTARVVQAAVQPYVDDDTGCSPAVTCHVLRWYTVTASVSVQMQAEVGAAAAFAVLLLVSLLSLRLAACMPAQLQDKPCRVILQRPDTRHFAIRYPVGYLRLFWVNACYLVRDNPR
jgi:hypothetical protein